MPNKHGDFIWYELMTKDADAAQEFYGPLLGWSFIDSGTPDMDYRLFSAGENLVGGLMAITPEMKSGGAQPFWASYIQVDDVEISIAAMKKAGAAVHMDPIDIPEVGRTAFLSDPQGAMFYVMKPLPPDEDCDGESLSFSAKEPMLGHCAWNELITSDPAGAKAFYEGQFGWQTGGEMDMGPMGKYEFWKAGGGRDFMIGGVMNKPDEMPVSAWMHYFRVADIDAAVDMIKAKGGKILCEPSEISGEEFVVNGQDPQGAFFALVGLRNRG